MGVNHRCKSKVSLMALKVQELSSDIEDDGMKSSLIASLTELCQAKPGYEEVQDLVKSIKDMLIADHSAESDSWNIALGKVFKGACVFEKGSFMNARVYLDDGKYNGVGTTRYSVILFKTGQTVIKPNNTDAGV